MDTLCCLVEGKEFCVNRRQSNKMNTVFGFLASFQAGIDVTKSAPSSNGHVIHRIERAPHHRKNKVCDVSHKKDLFSEEVTAYDLFMTYAEFMKHRPILMYPQIICSGCLVVMGMTIANTLSHPGALMDLLRYSSGRFSEFYTVIGVWFVIKVLYYSARLLWAQVVPNDRVFTKAGSWAVVTGCTSGIGREYALQLAAKGMDLVLISRNQNTLNELAEEISDHYAVRVMTHAADLASDDNAMYSTIYDKLGALDVGVLVNNAGVSSDTKLFHEMSSEDIMNILRVNINSLAQISRVFIPGMAARGRGIVINLASALGTTPAPLLASYGASKRFVDILTRALHQEYEEKGLFIQSVTPYFISTNMTKNVETGPLIPDAKTFVRHHLRTVGRDDTTYGFWPHALEGWFIKSLPTPIVRELMYYLKRRSERLAETRGHSGKH